MSKKLIVSSVSVSFSIFRAEHYTRSTVITNNSDDQGARAPLNSSFANHFKCITRVKLRVFVLKIASSSPLLTFFYERNAITRAGFIMHGTVPGPPRSDDKTFLIFICIWQEYVAKVPKVPRVPSNNMVSYRRNHRLYPFSIRTVHLLLASFSRQNTYEN